MRRPYTHRTRSLQYGPPHFRARLQRPAAAEPPASSFASHATMVYACRSPTDCTHPHTSISRHVMVKRCPSREFDPRRRLDIGRAAPRAARPVGAAVQRRAHRDAALRKGRARRRGAAADARGALRPFHRVRVAFGRAAPGVDGHGAREARRLRLGGERGPQLLEREALERLVVGPRHVEQVAHGEEREQVHRVPAVERRLAVTRVDAPHADDDGRAVVVDDARAGQPLRNTRWARAR
eukprot:3031788-Prymnesium_polylepis.1